MGILILTARADLDDFVACYNPENRHQRQPTWSESNPEVTTQPPRCGAMEMMTFS